MAVRVQREDFDLGAELEALRAGRHDIGALVSFTGLVRDTGGLESMELEHYPGMTEKALAGIEADARGRWPLQACLIVHRYGRLLPGEQIMMVATASSHREAAFAAAAAWHAIQYLGIVWFHNRNRFRGGLERQALVVSWVSQPGRWPFYFLLLWALAAAAYASILGLARLADGTSWTFNTFSLLVWTSLTLAHYYLDGVIWKLRRDEALAARLTSG